MRRSLTHLYNGATQADISTEVTFEDGRKGVIAARVQVRDVKTFPPNVRLEAAA